MYYNLIPLLLILISAVVIIRIVVKKFPAVVNLDVASLPKEKEKNLKQQIINNRLRRNINKWFLLVKKSVNPLWTAIKEAVKRMYGNLLNTRASLSKTAHSGSVDSSDIDYMFNKAEEAKKNGEYEDAEKFYIHIISADSKNIAAFKMLGQLYFEQEKFEEARETLEHVLKLTKEDAEVYSQLAEVAGKGDNIEKAKDYYQQSIKLNNENGQTYFNLSQLHLSNNNYKEALANMKSALKVEPKNPRYLDGLFSLSILMKDKLEALSAYKTLKEINPDNAKLSEMKAQIDEL